MNTQPARPAERMALWRPLVGLVADYLKWTQLVPMIMAWAFLLIMVAALVVTNFQQQSFALFEAGAAAYEWAFGPLEPINGEPPQSEPRSETTPSGSQEGVRLDEDSLRPWILKIWGALALVFWLLGLLRSWLFGPREPASLRRKLGRAAVAAAVASAVCFACWLLGSERFNGGPAGWIALFLGAPIVVWLVSAWSLSVGHLIDALAQRITQPVAAAEHR